VKSKLSLFRYLKKLSIRAAIPSPNRRNRRWRFHVPRHVLGASATSPSRTSSTRLHRRCATRRPCPCLHYPQGTRCATVAVCEPTSPGSDYPQWQTQNLQTPATNCWASPSGWDLLAPITYPLTHSLNQPEGSPTANPAKNWDLLLRPPTNFGKYRGVLST